MTSKTLEGLQRPSPSAAVDSGLAHAVQHRDGNSSRLLYLGTNNNQPLNGDEKYEFTVRVCVARRTLRNLAWAVG